MGTWDTEQAKVKCSYLMPEVDGSWFTKIGSCSILCAPVSWNHRKNLSSHGPCPFAYYKHKYIYMQSGNIYYWMCQSVNSRAVRLLPRPNMYVSAMIQIAYCFMKCCQFKMCTRTTFADVNGILGFVHFAKTPCVYALANIRYTWWLLSILLLLLLNVWNNNNYILCAYRTCATMPGHIFCTNVLNSIQPDAYTHSQ